MRSRNTCVGGKGRKTKSSTRIEGLKLKLLKLDVSLYYVQYW